MVVGWTAFALSSIGLIVTLIEFIYARGLMLSGVGMGLVTMIVGMAFGLAAAPPERMMRPVD